MALIKKFKLIVLSLVVFLFTTQINYAQIDFNKKPDDDLGEIKDEFQVYFFEALKQKGIENYQLAVDALNKCLKIDDSKPVIYFQLGKNYNLLNNFNEAETALKKAIAIQPDNEWFLDELYDVYYKQDDIDNAIITLKQLVKYHQDYKQDLATLYIKKEQFSKALQVLDELDNELGTDDVREQMRNNIYNLTGDATDAINNLKKRINANPQNENNYLQLIYRYSQTGKAKQAFETAKTLLEIKPESQYAHLALYKFYLEERQIDKAVTSMKLVINSKEIEEEAKAKVFKDFLNFTEKNPEYKNQLIEATDNVNTNKSEEALSSLGDYYSKSGNPEKALKNYKAALAKNPSDFKLLKAIILLQIETKHYNEALKQSYEALELYPAQPILYLLNGIANSNLNHHNKAIESLEMGLDFLVENPKMERAFYNQLSKVYKLTNNNKKATTFANKAKAIKIE